VCDLETSRIGAPYIYDISSLWVKLISGDEQHYTAVFQVDAGLRFENRKQKYQHMFDVKTPKRVYYLAAESEEDMNRWVEYVCHVCGLKAYKDEDGTSVSNPKVL